jgi:hypothetical protein
MSELRLQLVDLALSHSMAVSTLERFIQQVHTSLIRDRPPAPFADGDPLKHARLSPALLSTLTPEQSEKYWTDLREADAQIRGFREEVEKANLAFPDLLMRMSLIYRVALFDAFLSDLQLRVLTAFPTLLRDDQRSLTYDKIIDRVTEGRLVEFMAEQTVSSLDRRPIGKQLEKIRNRLLIGFTLEDDLAKEVTEIMARRNVFTHANGIVNDAYLSLVRDSQHPLGTPLNVTYAYWARADQLLRMICNELLGATFGKHCNGTAPPRIE